MLIKGNRAGDRKGGMAVGRKEGDQSQQAADDEGDPALDIEDLNGTSVLAGARTEDVMGPTALRRARGIRG